VLLPTSLAQSPACVAAVQETGAVLNTDVLVLAANITAEDEEFGRSISPFLALSKHYSSEIDFSAHG